MRTKQTIRDTLLRLLEEHSADDLTVKMVCMEAGVSKQTLYNHYYCLMDVLDESFQLAVDEALKDCNTYHDWVKGFQSFLELLARYKQVALHVYHSSHQDELIAMIRKNGEMLVRRGIEECSRDMGTAVSPKDEDFMLKFYMNVFIGVVESFMNGRMEESPEYLASRCDAMMRHHIRHTLENLKKLENGEF